MLAITTPTGNTGRHVAELAVARGEQVRLLIRDPAKLSNGLTVACDIVVGDMRDASALDALLKGANAVFFCVPQSADADDMRAYYLSFATVVSDAIARNGIGRVVTISGGDGEGSGGIGVGSDLYAMERMIEAAAPDVRHVRCGYFMENLFWQVQPLARAGVFSLPVGADVALPWVAAQDIGRAAGELLVDRTWNGHAGVAAHGPNAISCKDVASSLTQALGRPVAFAPVSGEQYTQTLMSHGCSRALGDGLVKMFDAIGMGKDMGATPDAAAECLTTLADWSNRALAPAITRVLQQVQAD